MIYVVSLQNTGKYTKNFNNFYRPAPLLFQNVEIKPHFIRKWMCKKRVYGGQNGGNGLFFEVFSPQNRVFCPLRIGFHTIWGCLTT